MLKILLKKISAGLSLYYLKKIRINNSLHLSVSFFLKKKLNTLFRKNPRMKTHSQLSREIVRIINQGTLNKFLRNSLIQNIFFIHNRFFILYELLELKKDKNWRFWRKLLKENDVGSPIRYFLYPRSSGNRIRQVYLLKKFISNIDLNKLNKFKNIIELGGGYGCMAQIFKNINTRINYHIYDMYEVNLLQYYYLRMNKNSPNLNFKKSGINLINQIKDLKFISKNYKIDLFIANWSLSEIPVDFRKKFIPIIKNSKYSIICFQEKFEKVNNSKFFKKLIAKFNNDYSFKFIDFEYYNGSIFNNSNHKMLIIKNKNYFINHN